MKSIIKSFILFLFFASSFSAFSQNAVTMMIIDAETLQPLSGVEVQIIETGESMVSGKNGQFTLSKEKIATESITLRFGKDDYIEKSYSVDVNSFNEKTLIYSISPIKEQVESDIPVISIDVAEDNDEDLGRVSGILNASRDAFVSAAFFNFSAARFRIRGYDSENTISYFNHTPANDLDNGRESYYAWGGLNDVTRLRSSTLGLALNDNSFGGMGGVNTLDSRASLQRKQFRVTYSMTNRSYRNRLMATYSSGWLKNGWAFSLSASHRWAQEGYVPGTFYDGYSYFASIDKKLGDNHRLNLTLLGAPVKSGRSAATSEEWKEIAGTNYYNPNWGFQNGEKRNSRVATSHQPFGILRYDFTKRQDFALTASASLRTGKYGTTNITWYDAKDPRVNRYNPFNIEDDAARERVLDLLMNDESARQMDWDYMYEVNRLREDEVYDAEGNLLASGLGSDYVLEEKRYDVTQGAGNLTANWILNNIVTLSGGIQHIHHQTHKYKLVDDLLGGDFVMDYDKFAQRDFSTDRDKWQSDLDNPDRVVKEGDVFGYDYKGHTRQSKGWLQAAFSWPRIDAFLSAQGENTQIWREGLMKNGKFPELSKGDSEKKSFLSPQGKAGITYKINGRNYIYATGAYIERAPFFRNAFLSPQVRNTWIPDITTEKIQGFEAGYTLSAPDVKATIRGYHTAFTDGFVNRRFFLTSTFGGGEYINYIMSDIEKLHQGIEFGARWNITSALSAEGAAALGQYVYTNRPNVNIIVDNNATEFEEVPTVYIKDFYLPGMPQQAYSLGFRYRSPNYWSVSLTGNYFDEAWLDFFPNRRTVGAVDNPGVEYGSDLYEQIIYQEKLPAAFTLNFFGSKSWKFNKHFIYLNVAVNNILNNQFLTGGYEQFKFDFDDLDLDRYPNRYYNAYGTNFYFSISYKY